MTKLVFAAAAFAAALTSTAALAAGDTYAQPSLIAAVAVAPTPALDLGVDVTGVTRTPAAVQGYLATLAPAARDALLQTCDAYSYTLDPKTVEDRETLAFCAIALGG